MKFSFLDQMKGELSSLLSCYPSFVFAFHPKPALDFVPVFTYHTIDPAMFEKELCYLKENEYTTLSPGEYFSIIRKEREAPPKAVLLTVDDGRLSFWKYGYPLLKKYGLRATLFIIPGSTVESEKRRANMLDVWAGGIAFDTLASLDAGDYELCSWSEIKEMYASGLINIESHTLFHKEVFISPRFVDYINPDTSFTLHNSSVTAYLNSKNIGRTLEPQSFFGRPLFESAPFMEGRAAVCIPASLQASCKEVFNNHVYPKESDSIREKIRLLVKTYFEIHPPSFQDMNDVEKALVQDLVAAKKSIQEKLDPEAGNFLCLPYGTGGPLAIKAAKKAEMQGCFWVTIPGRRFNARGGDPFSQVRIKSDFIVRLPGEGRSSLFSVYFMKSARRVSGRRVF